MNAKTGLISRADLILTSLGSDEAVEAVFHELFEGQEVNSRDPV